MRILKVIPLVMTCVLIICSTFNCSHSQVITNEVVESNEASEILEVTDTTIIEEIEIIDPYQERLNSYFSKCEEVNLITDAEEWFDAYLEMANEYSDIVTVPNLSDTLSDKDIEYLYRMVETETYQAPFSCKARVSCVAFNRLKDGRFQDNIVKIITHPKQFCYWRTNISEDTKKACLYAYIVGDITNGALFFDNNDKLSKDYVYLFTDEVGHNFYTTKKKTN